MNQNNIFTNNNYNHEDSEEEGFLSRTGNKISSFISKIRHSINPFRKFSYTQNPYDLNSQNDPSNYLNSVKMPNNNFTEKQDLRNVGYSSEFQRNNNFGQFQKCINNDQNENENEKSYLTMDNLLNLFPNLRPEIFKDFKRPIYMPNEQIFQEAKKYVYQNLVNQYLILEPKTDINNFVEKAIVQAIQLVNKHNIDEQYEFLINRKKCNYKIIVDVPEIIKNYNDKKKKSLLIKDTNNENESVSNDIKKEMINKLSYNLYFNKKDKEPIYDLNNENRVICRTPKTKRSYIEGIIENKLNYEYLCPNDKLIIKIFQDCLAFRENEIRKYEKVIEVTNNMFKFICNENEKLKNELSQKNLKLDNFTKENALKTLQNKDYEKQINDYKKQISTLNNNQKKNKFYNLQKTNFNTNYIINNNNLIKANSNNNAYDIKTNINNNISNILSNTNNNKSNNINNNNNLGDVSLFEKFENKITESNNHSQNIVLTLKKPFENKENIFTFGNKKEISDDKGNIFENNNSSKSIFPNLKNEKEINNKKDSSFLLNLNNQVIDNNLNLTNNNKQSDEKKEFILFNSTPKDKSNEVKIQNQNQKELNIFAASSEAKNNNNKKEEEEQKKESNIFSSIAYNIDKSSDKQNNEKKEINIFTSSSGKNDINKNNIFIQNNQQEDEKKYQNIETKTEKIVNTNKKEINEIKEKEKELIINSENKEKEIKGNEKKEESNIKINPFTVNNNLEENKKEENKSNEEIKKETNLNNPNNPFLTAPSVSANIKNEFNYDLIKKNAEKNTNLNDTNNQNVSICTTENTNQ